MKHVLYVGGLPEATTVDHLKALFSIYGLVLWARVARHTVSQRSKRYGFVEMASGGQALRALVELDGALFRDSCLQLYLTPMHRWRANNRNKSWTRIVSLSGPCRCRSL